MDADYDIFEVVTVTRDFWLFDAESYQRRYRTKHGQPLAPGYYVVNWPEHIRARRFNEQAAFHGPFESNIAAHLALAEMRQQRELNLAIFAENNFIRDIKNSSRQIENSISNSTVLDWRPAKNGFQAPDQYDAA